MKNMRLGIGLLVGGLLAASPVQASHCCGGHAGHKHTQKHEPATAQAADEEITLQTTCPVMGGEIDKSLYVDHAGKRVYICCKGCEAPLKKNPSKYIEKLEDSGVTVARLQTACPVKIDKELYVDHDGKRIYVCREECIAEVRKDPAKHIKCLEARGVALHTAGEAGKAAESKKPAAGHEGHRH